MALSATHTRLIVQVPGYRVDVAVAHDLAMDEVVAEIVVFLRQLFDAQRDDDGYDEVREYLADPYAAWQIVSATGTHYRGDVALADAGLVDGSVVVLTASKQRENYLPVIDDTAEAIAHYQRIHFGQWVSADSRMLAGWLLPLSAALVGAVLVYGVASDALSTIGKYAACGATAFIALMVLVAAVIGRVDDGDREIDHVYAGVVTAGYVLLGTSALLAVPGSAVGVYNLLLSGAVVTLAAFTVTSRIRFPEPINYATITAGTLVMVGAGFGAATHSGALEIALVLAVVTMAFYLSAQKLALILAGYPKPWVPSQGETFLRDDAEDLARFEPDERSSVIAAIMNQERQAQTARDSHVGMGWGALAVMAGCAVISGANLNDRQYLIFALWGAILLGILFRGKSLDDALKQRSWLLGTFGIGVAFLVAAALSEQSPYNAVIIAAVAVAVGVAVGAYGSVKVKLINSPLVARMLELIEMLCYASPVVLVMLILGVFSQVRGR